MSGTIWKPEYFADGGTSEETLHSDLSGLTTGDAGHTQFPFFK